MLEQRLDWQIRQEKLIWDLVAVGKVTLTELETHYSFEDLQRMLAVDTCNYDYQKYLENKALKQSKAKNGKHR